MIDELAFRPATELAELVRAREVSPVELAQLYLERIERLDPTLNAYVTVAAEQTLADARAARAGPFAGVPISIKDLHETAGIRTTFSCRAFADYVPPFDVAAVRRLRDAGFVILGKTNTPEFGTIGVTESELNGACRNPWDTTRTPGGSSGGAAAALAAGLCPVAQGSDGGGSIRNPASCCGLVGLKPSRGRVSPAPWAAGLLGLATSGALTRTVRDAAALLDVLAGPEPGDTWSAAAPARPFAEEPDTPPGRLRVAVTVEPPLQVRVDAACADAARAAALLLETLGHDVVEQTPPWGGEDIVPHFLRVWAAGTGLWSDYREQLEPINRALLDDADATTSVELMVAVVELQSQARRFIAFWDEFDMLVTPTLALEPVPVGWAFADEDDPRAQFARFILFTPFTPVVNVSGQPAISLPLSEENGVPIGVQLVGPPGGEALLLRVSAQLEEARRWADRRPQVS